MTGKSTGRDRVLVRLNFQAVPIQASLGVLGRRWALRILMSIALGQAQRFNEILRATPGMGKRILAMRLRELERDGFIARAEIDHAYTKWEPTKKGVDVLPVLLTLIQFRSKWRAPGEGAAETPPALGRSFEISYLRARHERPTNRGTEARRRAPMPRHG